MHNIGQSIELAFSEYLSNLYLFVIDGIKAMIFKGLGMTKNTE